MSVSKQKKSIQINMNVSRMVQNTIEAVPVLFKLSLIILIFYKMSLMVSNSILSTCRSSVSSDDKKTTLVFQNNT
jgi:hypothetical protein